MKKKRILVSITGQKTCERLLDKGRLLKESDSDELYMLHVMNDDQNKFDPNIRALALDFLFDLASEYGAIVQVFSSGDAIERICEFVKEHNIDTLVLGESCDSSRQKELLDRINDNLTNKIDVHVVNKNL